MASFRLGLLSRLIGSVDLDETIIMHEVKRLPRNRLGSLAYIFDILGGIEYVFTLTGFWVPFVHWLWRIPTILVAATVLSHEFEDRTWNTLRSTPLSVHAIVIHKFAAIIRYMEPHWMLVFYLRAMPVVIFGVAWTVSTLTVLPRQGMAYWVSTSLAILFAGIYLLVSPLLDVAIDGALGLFVSSYCNRRATAMVLTVLARIAGFLLPLALVIPLEAGVFTALNQAGAVRLRTLTVMTTFGPSYAFLWGVDAWLSILIVIAYAGLRLALVRLLLAGAIRRASQAEMQ